MCHFLGKEKRYHRHYRENKCVFSCVCVCVCEGWVILLDEFVLATEEMEHQQSICAKTPFRLPFYFMLCLMSRDGVCVCVYVFVCIYVSTLFTPHVLTSNYASNNWHEHVKRICSRHSFCFCLQSVKQYCHGNLDELFNDCIWCCVSPLHWSQNVMLFRIKKKNPYFTVLFQTFLKCVHIKSVLNMRT